MRTLLFALMVVAALPARAEEKLAAVRICFSGLDPSSPLFLDHPAPHYRTLDDGASILDLDLRFDGEAPTRLTRTSATCLRAWLPAHPVHQLSIHFERTATNVLPVEQETKVRLVADKWSDLGTVTVKLGAESSVETALPGTMSVSRVELLGEATVTNPSRLPMGSYLVRYVPPPAPRLDCPTTLTVDAGGTVRADNHPELVQELAAHYQKEILPSVLATTHESCTPEETLAVHLEIWDGVYLHPWDPERRKIAAPARQPRYALAGKGTLLPYVPGQAVSIGYGEHLRLVSVTDDAAYAAR